MKPRIKQVAQLLLLFDLKNIKRLGIIANILFLCKK